MSKEYLEAFRDILGILSAVSGCEVDMNSERIITVKSALKRLEAIDNANPSEALVCWQWINATIPQWVREKDKEHPNVLEPIKQALLKAQEPKHYLKWEDLEFNIEKQMMEVLLNGTKYTLIVGSNTHIDKLAFLKNGEINYYFLEADKQFFNDLHLERVEE